MAVRAYVLIEAEVGRSKGVGEAIVGLKHAEAKIAGVDTVTGPYDVIVQVEADDLDKLGKAITESIQSIEGVARTTTCLAVRLS
jgi:DNA-binding Lrp family transcriptional regulator